MNDEIDIIHGSDDIGKFICNGFDTLKEFSDRSDDVAPCGACRPWIFLINGVLCFLKINGSGMKMEER